MMTLPEGRDLSSVTVLFEYAAGDPEVCTSNEGAKVIYAALLQDAEEGNLPAVNTMASASSRSVSPRLILEYSVPLSPLGGTWTYDYKPVYLAPQMTNTIDALVELGCLTEEDVAFWVKQQ